MKYIKTYEEINYYQYTLDEVKYKLFGNQKQRSSEHVMDGNLLYLIKLYIIYKEGYKNTEPEDIRITAFDKQNNDKIIIPYLTNTSNPSDIFDVSTWLPIENENEFINFINDPELFIETQKYNL